MIKIKNLKNDFSLSVSLNVFLYSIIILFLGLLTPDVLYTYGILYPILMIVTIGIIIYSIISHKKRSVKDYIIIGIIFASVLAINIQCFAYFYRARTGDYYYSLFYEFPGFLKFNKHWLVSIEPLRYELQSTIILFDPTFITSIVCICLSLFLKQKMKNSDNLKIINRKYD